MRCMPISEMHTCEMHVYEWMHAYKEMAMRCTHEWMQAYDMHACEMHACEMHACEMPMTCTLMRCMPIRYTPMAEIYAANIYRRDARPPIQPGVVPKLLRRRNCCP